MDSENRAEGGTSAGDGRQVKYDEARNKPAESRRLEAEKRNRLYRELMERGIENMENWDELSAKQLRSALTGLEQRIRDIECNISEVESFLADPGNFRDGGRSAEATQKFDRLHGELKKLYETWEAVSSHLEKHVTE